MIINLFFLLAFLLGFYQVCESFTVKRSAALHPRSTTLRMQDEKVVVTGLGIICPSGNTVTEFFDNICKGETGISKIDRFDATKFKCQIVAASKMALEDAGLDLLAEGSAVDGCRVGVVVGSAFGGMETFERAALDLAENGPSSIGPYTIPMILGNTPAGIIAMETGAKGPNFGVQTACATATHAFGEAMRLIKNGDADVMIAGGTEAPLTPLSFAGFCNLMAMNFNYNDNPTKASRPFDLNRGGFIMGEGAGVLVLESLSHAVKRGARVYCELAGYGASCDAYHITSPDPEGQGLKRAILSCLAEGNIRPDEVQYVNAHGTSTKKNDFFETVAYKQAFGEEHARKLRISSIKGSTGHSLGAAGGFEAIATIKALETGVIPPTINYETPDPECDLDYTPNKAVTVSDLKIAMSDNLGFGGHNGVVAFRKLD